MSATLSLSDNFDIRPATLDDVEAVVDLVNVCSIEQTGKPRTEAHEIRNDWSAPTFNMETDTLVVLAPDGSLVGRTALWDAEPHVRVYVAGDVHPEYKGQGIGTALCRWAEERGRQAVLKAPEGTRVVLVQDRLNTDEAAQELLAASEGEIRQVAPTLEDVARFKLEQARGRVGGSFFIEDAGFFVEALNGFPGVYSSHALKALGCEGILKLLRGVRSREAYFKAVIAFADPKGKLRTFTGICRGKISLHARGSRGFGFDPIFIPNGYEKTFAEDIEMKNRVSHRRRAIDKFVKFLRDAHAGKAR